MPKKTIVSFALIAALIVLLITVLLTDLTAQTYYYDGGKISQSDLRRARSYKKGTFLVQGGKNSGMIWIPKHDARGNRWLRLLMEHFLQGVNEIRDYAPVQVGTIVGGSHGMASVLALLMDPDTRDVLKIDKEQGEKINDEFVRFRAQLNERMKELQRTDPNASRLQIALTRTSEIERISLTLEPRLETFLSKEQIQQAKEIVFQLSGGFNTAVVDLDILSLFDLTKEQREKLELVSEDANAKRDKVFAAKEYGWLDVRDCQAFDKAMGEVAYVISNKIRVVLTPEQVKKGNELMADIDRVKKELGLDK